MGSAQPQNIYFDESGFTGNNLLHPEQKFFAYASIATSDEEAQKFVERIINKYNIQNGELKGSKLVRFHRGRKAIDEIFSEFAGRIKISLSEKKFALACKLFEYIFEPSISQINSAFYRVGFHKFVATMLYLEFSARAAGAEELFVEFEELMRRKREADLTSLFSSSADPENSHILANIREFAQARADDVRTELESLESSGLGKWTLDLTSTALFTLLANWGTEYGELCAICDQSKPLQDEHHLFSAMIGRENQIFSNAFGVSHPITFNLSEPIRLVDSRMVHGIQIADAVAAAAVHTISGAQNDHANRWRLILPSIAHYGSVLPEHDAIDPTSSRAHLNARLLLELHSRATNGRNLVDGMQQFIERASARFLNRSVPWT